MKHKKPTIHKQPWTPFREMEIPDIDKYIGDAEPPAHIFSNSRYQVSMWLDEDPTMGKFVHLSIRDHDRSARHDWRDLQRIKNELCGDEFDAVEVYPAESRLVDTANQYHLFVFATWHPRFGFRSRLVADGKSAYAPKAEQRPFESRPADCLSGEQLNDAAMRAVSLAKAAG